MSLTGRLKRRLGYDTTIEVERTEPRYKYEILHTNGEVTTFKAHGHDLEGAFAKPYNYVDLYHWVAFNHSIAPIKQHTKELDSIQEIDRWKVGTTEMKLEVDTADNTVLNKEIRND